MVGLTGQKVSLHKNIAQSFGEYYFYLYNLPDNPPSQTQLNNYLSSAHLPRLSSLQWGDLEVPITLEELQSAVGSAKPGKAASPDSYTILYYKTLLPLLGPHMVKTFNALGQSSSFPSVTLLAHI